MVAHNSGNTQSWEQRKFVKQSKLHGGGSGSVCLCRDAALAAGACSLPPACRYTC